MIAVNGDTELVWESHGRGPDLVLIHGLGYARWGWKPLVPLLSEHFRVTAFDNRGIGDSSVPPGPYTAAEMASDAEAVLDAADVTKAHIVGTSLGGMIAQELALTVPERVDHLALMSTTPGAPLGHPMPAVTVDLLKKAPSIEPTMALRLFVENALGSDPDAGLVDEIVGLRMANVQDPAGWAAQAAAGTTHRGGSRAKGITAPTLVMSGTHDNVVDHRNSIVLADQIPGATLELMPDLGHLMFWEDPRRVAQRLIGFLS